MEQETINQLDELKSNLYDELGEIEAIILQIDEDSLPEIMKALDEIQSKMDNARKIVKEIRKL